jgi:cysteinyl-tRNA synthetase
MVEYLGEKMSKSLGNLVIAGNVLERNSADAFRLYLFSHHYRSEWEYMDDEIDDWETLARDMYEAIETPSYAIGGDALDVDRHVDQFLIAMDNDLDTGSAIGHLRAITAEILAADDTDTSAAQRELRTLGGILGLTLER